MGKKAEEEGIEEVGEVATGLEAFCSGDREAYEALQSVMLLDPRKMKITMKEAADNAKDSEKRGDNLKARIGYQVAGELAIYKGDVKSVRKYFSKCEELAPDISCPILKDTERAVAKAQEYYKKYLTE